MKQPAGGGSGHRKKHARGSGSAKHHHNKPKHNPQTQPQPHHKQQKPPVHTFQKSPKGGRRGLAVADETACCVAEALAVTLYLAANPFAQPRRDWPWEGLSHEPGWQIADLVAEDDSIDVALIGRPHADRQGSGWRMHLPSADLDAPALAVMHDDQIARALRGESPEYLISPPKQVNGGDHFCDSPDVTACACVGCSGSQRHNGFHGRDYPSVDGLARPSRLASSIISDSDVLTLYRHTADDPDEGASILATLEAAAEFGLAGVRPVSFARVDPDDPAAVILGVSLPGAHAVAVSGGHWSSWGGWWPPGTWPDAVIEEAWGVTWPS